ncbi:hypothetical protein TTHT_1266 [Thermotomaculum hydrothermale]|uniref:Tetratricopeptide repeat protein n=1 Tax=Thermotomaculum hydrothermale TaxID=981385 RepID=A0A7R6PHN2_9BACT|nr:tetratricopeptide repeat protein [Thermotomaculum hydrothermale]BBB32784.1 hypothetical protein TTHT_1266 [Thermotomaculum hydrothermale]
MKKTVILVLVFLLSVNFVKADYKLGYKLYKQGKIKQALQEFQVDAEKYSYWYFPSYMAAMCYYQLKDYKAALEMLRMAENAAMKSDKKVVELPKVKILEAKVLAASGKCKEAIKLCSKYIPQSPAEFQAMFYFIKGKCENKLKNHSKAVVDLKNSTGINPKNPSAWFELGLAYIHNRNLDGAIKSLTKSMQLYPKSKATYYLLTDTLINKARRVRDANSKKKYYLQAVDVANKGLKYFPGDKKLQLNLANAYLGAKQYSTAINLFSQLYKKYPNDTQVVFGLGSAYMGNKDYKNALPYLLKVKGKMNNALIYNFIATAQLAIGKNENNLSKCKIALKTVNDGLRKFPGNRNLLKKKKEAQEIIARFEKNLEIEKKNKQIEQENKRKLANRIMTLKGRIRKAEEIKRKSGRYPASYESDKAELEKALKTYEKLYGKFRQ